MRRDVVLHAITTVAAGSHTIKVQWYRDSAGSARRCTADSTSRPAIPIAASASSSCSRQPRRDRPAGARTAKNGERQIMDYATLRKEGIRLLERMSGGSGRTSTPTIPASRCSNSSAMCPVRTLPIAPGTRSRSVGRRVRPVCQPASPDAILSCEPVTQADLRRVVLDVEGVRTPGSSR